MKLILCLCVLALTAIGASAQNSGVKKFANDSEVPRVTVEEAKKSFDDGSAVFVDSRSVEAYKQERIKGAVLVEGTAENRFDSLPKGKKIIVYCA
jgi:hypothetical protein